ncbi:MAG: hypothetical protein GIW94_12230 [Candidatus Eremiobacteraeota bacterium]|nr:hypothetical protein [Candidatus Eremiobacteraeota bacterium]
MASPRPASTAARLLALARLWGDIKYFHPYLAYRNIDWDGALSTAIPKVEGATTSADYAAAVESMLDALHDPATRVVDRSSDRPTTPHDEEPFVTARDRGGGAALVAFDWNADVSSLTDGTALSIAARTISASKSVVVDLRTPRATTDQQADGVDYAMESQLGKMLLHGETTLPAQRTRWYHGLPNQVAGENWGQYDGGFRTADARRFPGTAPMPRRVAFLADANSYVPRLAVAMARDGSATILTTGGQPDHDDGDTSTLALADGVVAQIRLGEYADVAADAPVAENLDSSGDPVAAAFTRIEKHPAVSQEMARPPMGRFTDDDPDSSPPFPDDAHRLLGVFRIYNAARYFFAYRPLMGDDWDGATLQAIGDVRAARDARSYVLAIERYYAYLHDSHGFVGGRLPATFFGAGVPWKTR